MHRRTLLMTLAALPLARPAVAQPQAIVYKSPTCGCCSAWIDHLNANGVDAEGRDLTQDGLNALKMGEGITPALASCHTALIGGYVVEGHVPAADIHRLLAEAPEAIGLTVPGMPMGSPGMEMGDAVDPYDTLLILPGGTTEVFASHA